MTQDTISNASFLYTDFKFLYTDFKVTPDSSMIAAILYDEATCTIGVLFNGKDEVYTYQGNSPYDFQAFAEAVSVGQHYNQELYRDNPGLRYARMGPRPEVEAVVEPTCVDSEPAQGRTLRVSLTLENIASHDQFNLIMDDIESHLNKRYAFFSPDVSGFEWLS